MVKPISELNYLSMVAFVDSVPEECWSDKQKLLGAIKKAYKFFRKSSEIAGPYQGSRFEMCPMPPIDDLKPKSKVRYGHLSIEELAIAYAAALRMKEQNLWHSGFLRLCILLPRRTGTIRAMRWDNLILTPTDGSLPRWIVPAAFNKKGPGNGNGQIQEVPLTQRMISILREMEPAGDFVFGGESIRINPSRIVQKLRDWSGLHTDRNGNQWDLHSVRKTIASSRLGLTHMQMIEFICGRRPNIGAQKNYYHGHYLEEQLETLMIWERMLFTP